MVGGFLEGESADSREKEEHFEFYLSLELFLERESADSREKEEHFEFFLSLELSELVHTHTCMA